MRTVVQCTTEDQQRTHTQLAVLQAEQQQHLMELQQHLIDLQQELQQHLPVHVSKRATALWQRRLFVADATRLKKGS
jgi:hypothetical protein